MNSKLYPTILFVVTSSFLCSTCRGSSIRNIETKRKLENKERNNLRNKAMGLDMNEIGKVFENLQVEVIYKLGNKERKLLRDKASGFVSSKSKILENVDSERMYTLGNKEREVLQSKLGAYDPSEMSKIFERLEKNGKNENSMSEMSKHFENLPVKKKSNVDKGSGRKDQVDKSLAAPMAGKVNWTMNLKAGEENNSHTAGFFPNRGRFLKAENENNNHLVGSLYRRFL